MEKITVHHRHDRHSISLRTKEASDFSIWWLQDEFNQLKKQAVSALWPAVPLEQKGLPGLGKGVGKLALDDMKAEVQSQE